MRRRQAAFSLKTEVLNCVSLYYVSVFSCGYVFLTQNCATYQTFTIPGQRWTQPRYLAPLRELEKTTLPFTPSSDCYAMQQILSTLYCSYIQILAWYIH